jgi:hypothetical protein
MRHGWRQVTALAALCCLASLPGAHAETQWPSTSGSMQPHLAPLDDRDLMSIQGAAMDVATLVELQKGKRQGGQDDDARRHRTEAAQTAQTAQALTAALTLQNNLAVRLSTSAINGVNTATQIGGTLIALTPVAAIAPIGMPLFGLPALPPRAAH